jgi:hypothetical protein
VQFVVAPFEDTLLASAKTAIEEGYFGFAVIVALGSDDYDGRSSTIKLANWGRRRVAMIEVPI